MILYLDTSSLVKLYIAEAHSELVQDWVGEAEAVATSRVAYPEALLKAARSEGLSTLHLTVREGLVMEDAEASYSR